MVDFSSSTQQSWCGSWFWLFLKKSKNRLSASLVRTMLLEEKRKEQKPQQRKIIKRSVTVLQIVLVTNIYFPHLNRFLCSFALVFEWQSCFHIRSEDNIGQQPWCSTSKSQDTVTITYLFNSMSLSHHKSISKTFTKSPDSAWTHCGSMRSVLALTTSASSDLIFWEMYSGLSRRTGKI